MRLLEGGAAKRCTESERGEKTGSGRKEWLLAAGRAVVALTGLSLMYIEPNGKAILPTKELQAA